MSSDPWGFDEDLFAADDQLGGPVAAEQGTSGRSVGHRPVLGAVSFVVAVVTLLVSLAGARGYVAVGFSALAYLLAVWVDLSTRAARHASRNYRRPKSTVALRSATFVMALVVGWLAASSLAGVA